MMKTPIFEKAASNRERRIVPILGILVDSTSKARALNRAWELGYRGPPAGGEGNGGNKGKRTRLVVTPNPEIIVAGQKDKSLARVLNSADLAVPDGIGVVMAMRYLSMGEMGVMRVMGVRPIALLLQGLWVGLSLFINRRWLFEISEVVPGRWLFEELVQKSAKEGKRIFLLGGKPGVAEKAAAKFQIPRLRRGFGGQANSPSTPSSGPRGKFQIQTNEGPWLNLEGEPRDKEQQKIEKKVIQEINKFKPDFLFVGFGHPKQEKWLLRNLPKLKVGVAMTVGGAFDYLAGNVPKPPQWVGEIGLEWLWRLLTQPWRIGRIFTAVIVFPLKLYLYRLGFLQR